MKVILFYNFLRSSDKANRYLLKETGLKSEGFNLLIICTVYVRRSTNKAKATTYSRFCFQIQFPQLTLSGPTVTIGWTTNILSSFSRDNFGMLSSPLTHTKLNRPYQSGFIFVLCAHPGVERISSPPRRAAKRQ